MVDKNKNKLLVSSMVNNIVKYKQQQKKIIYYILEKITKIGNHQFVFNIIDKYI